MHDGEHHQAYPAPIHLPLPMPTIHPVPPPNDETRQLVKRAMSRSNNPAQHSNPYWVQAELQQAGHEISREVIQGVINGL